MTPIHQHFLAIMPIASEAKHGRNGQMTVSSVVRASLPARIGLAAEDAGWKPAPQLHVA
jgi:hypothetical protein